MSHPENVLVLDPSTFVRRVIHIDGVAWSVVLTPDGNTVVCFDSDTCFDTGCPSLTGVLVLG